MVVLAEIGLAILIFAWFTQLVAGRKREFLILFILIYILGVVFLVIDAFVGQLWILGVLNIVTALLAFLVLLKDAKRN